MGHSARFKPEGFANFSISFGYGAPGATWTKFLGFLTLEIDRGRNGFGSSRPKRRPVVLIGPRAEQKDLNKNGRTSRL